MFEALWLKDGQFISISIETALDLNYREEQFISTDKEDIEEYFKKEGLVVENEDMIDFFSVRVKKCTQKRSHFFRYDTIKDYRKLNPLRKRKYEIVEELRHYENSEWHEKWVDALGQFCDITEKRKVNTETGKYKYPDALCEATKTVFEVQHSYIGSESYKERNDFYKELGYKVVWIIDCTEFSVSDCGNNHLIVESNNRQTPLFKLLTFDVKENDIVYIQDKTKKIYRVYNAKQPSTKDGSGSAIWLFDFIDEEYDDQDDFIEAVKNRVDYQNAVTEYYEKIQKAKAEQERLLKEQKEREERLRKEKEQTISTQVKNQPQSDALKNLWDTLPKKYKMEARIMTPEREIWDVLVCHFPDNKLGFETPFRAKFWSGSRWYPVSGKSKVIRTYIKPVLMNKYR